ncbi:hypothetical protein V5O48_014306, partial [Marasmius crinis-equi]
MGLFEGLAARLIKFFGNYGDAYQTNNEGSGNTTNNNSTVDMRHNFSIGQIGNRTANEELKTSNDGSSTSQQSAASTGSSSSETVPEDITFSDRYVSLLLRSKLGYPMWKPSPNPTPIGVEGDTGIRVGDVGILKSNTPFDTLFNITQSRNSAINAMGVPSGFQPLSSIRLMTDDPCHSAGAVISQPGGSISVPEAVSSGSGHRTYHFTSSHPHGALLMLPRGSCYQTVSNTSLFRRYVQKHWRGWYDFAEEHGDLNRDQELYVVTGFEKCCSWALAVFDHVAINSSISLPLTVEEDRDFYRWGNSSEKFYCDPRCETRSHPVSRRQGPEGMLNRNQCVFLHGFWVNRFGEHSEACKTSNTKVTSQDDASFEPGDGRNWGSRNPFRSTGSFSSPVSSPSSGSDNAGGFSRSILQARGSDVFEVEISDFDLHYEFMTLNPCRAINQFILSLLHRLDPSLLSPDCVAISHDSTWMSEEIGVEAFSSGNELIKQICAQYKFVIEKGKFIVDLYLHPSANSGFSEVDTIHTESLSEDFQDRTRVHLGRSKTLIPVYLEIRPSENEKFQPSLSVIREDGHRDEGSSSQALSRENEIRPSATSANVSSGRKLKRLGSGAYSNISLCAWHDPLASEMPLAAMEMSTVRPDWAGKRLVAVKAIKGTWQNDEEWQKLPEIQ